MEVLKAKVFDLNNGRSLYINAEENRKSGICALGIDVVGETGEDNTIAAVDYSREEKKIFIRIYDKQERPIFTKEVALNGTYR